MKENGYQPPISPDLQVLVKTGLENVHRWKNGLFSPLKEQNDWEHTMAMHDIADEIQLQYPSLSQEVEWNTTHDMIYIHDIGEIISDDLTHSHPQYELLKQRIKRREHAGFSWLAKTFAYSQRHELRRFYRRTIAKKDREALMCDLIDKVEGG